MDSKFEYYLMWLPCFKQGDDLNYHLDNSETISEAFLGLAQQYEDCAAQCKRMSGIAKEIPELEVDADCHHIGVYGPEDRLASLVKEDILRPDDFMDDEECSDDYFVDHSDDSMPESE